MTKINCEIFNDLLPLVIDNVASKESEKAVLNHIDECTDCKEIYDSMKKEMINDDLEEIEINDKKVLFNIKKKLYMITILVLITGSFIAISLMDSINMFYNILILPTLGLISYLVFFESSYKVAIGVFITSYIWQFIKIFMEMEKPRELYILFLYPTYLSFLFYILFMIGIIIGVLFKFGLSKEEEYEIEN